MSVIKYGIFIMIIFLALPLFSEKRVIDQTVARVGENIITEMEIKRFYSLFIDPGNLHFYKEEFRQDVLNSLIEYLVLKELLNTYQFYLDEREMHKRGEEIFNQFKNSFPSRDNYQNLMTLLHLDESQVKERIIEYFSTMHKMGIILEGRLREEKKIELKQKQEKRFYFELLILPRDIDNEILFSTLLNNSSLKEAYHAFEGKGIKGIIQSHRISEEEQINPQLQQVLDSLPVGAISLPFEVRDHYQIVQLLDIAWYSYERQERVEPGDYEELQNEILQTALEIFPVEFYD